MEIILVDVKFPNDVLKVISNHLVNYAFNSGPLAEFASSSSQKFHVLLPMWLDSL